MENGIDFSSLYKNCIASHSQKTFSLSLNSHFLNHIAHILNRIAFKVNFFCRYFFFKLAASIKV